MVMSFGASEFHRANSKFKILEEAKTSEEPRRSKGPEGTLGCQYAQKVQNREERTRLESGIGDRNNDPATR